MHIYSRIGWLSARTGVFFRSILLDCILSFNPRKRTRLGFARRRKLRPSRLTNARQVRVASYAYVNIVTPTPISLKLVVDNI